MNGSLEPRIARPTRRWTHTAGQRLTVVGSLVAFLLLVAAAPVAASARPTPGGISDPIGRDDWSGWSVKPPSAQPVSTFRSDLQPPDIQASVASIAGPYAVGSTVLVDFTCTDSGSGLRWCPIQATLDTEVSGYHSASFQAVDVAGNVATVVIAYTVVAGRGTPMIVFPAPGGEWA